MLLSAYRQGVFPWYTDDQPVLWWSPDPRFVLKPDRIHISRSHRRHLRKRPYRFTTDAAFGEVIRACATVPRPEQGGTWITEDMMYAYIELHDLGAAHSVEVWDERDLVGGLYGVSVGSVFAGESMFSYRDNASKSALAVLAYELSRRGAPFIDCQIPTPHVEAAGGEAIRRKHYLEMLKLSLLSDSIDDLWAAGGFSGVSFYRAIENGTF